MQDIYVDPGVLTFPLRLAMVASRAASVLKGVESGRPLDEKGKNSLIVLSDLVNRAVAGGEVFKSKSMASYSSEAINEALQEFSVILTEQSLRENVGAKEVALQLK
jgi:hypothetical protein